MTRSATLRTCSASLTSCRSTANSSPPSRAARSPRLERAEQAAGDRLQQLVADRVPERVVDRLEVVEVEEEDGVVAPARGEQLAEPVEEERAVGQAGERVVEGLVLEAALELAQLGDEVLEAVVLQRDARVVGQRAEEREVVAVEAADRAAVGDQEGADDARLARERGEHRALDAAAGQGRVEERVGQRALEQPRGRVAVDQRVQGIGHVAVGEHHRLDRAALLDRRAQRLGALVGGQQDDLGEVAAEDVERALQQARDAGRDVGRAREQARDLVQELEALVLAPLGHVGAVGEHDGRGRDDEQHGRARSAATAAAPPRARHVLVMHTAVAMASVRMSLAKAIGWPERRMTAHTSSAPRTALASVASMAAPHTLGSMTASGPAARGRWWRRGRRRARTA